MKKPEPNKLQEALNSYTDLLDYKPEFYVWPDGTCEAKIVLKTHPIRFITIFFNAESAQLCTPYSGQRTGSIDGRYKRKFLYEDYNSLNDFVLDVLTYAAKAVSKIRAPKYKIYKDQNQWQGMVLAPDFVIRFEPLDGDIIATF